MPGGLTLTPDVPVRPYVLSVMERNPSDREEGNRRRAYNKYKERFFNLTNEGLV